MATKPYQTTWTACNSLKSGILATGTLVLGNLTSKLGSWQPLTTWSLEPGFLFQPENWNLVQPWMTGTGTHHNAFRRLNNIRPRRDWYSKVLRPIRYFNDDLLTTAKRPIWYLYKKKKMFSLNLIALINISLSFPAISLIVWINFFQEKLGILHFSKILDPSDFWDCVISKILEILIKFPTNLRAIREVPF